MKNSVLLIFVSLFLAACSSTPTTTLPPVYEGGTRVPEKSPDGTADASSPAGGSIMASKPKPNQEIQAREQRERAERPMSVDTPSGGAVVALLEKADYFHSTGDLEAEAATIERALRINPGDAHLWSRLAAVRLEQGQAQQAEQMALKSNSLAAGNKHLLAKNWLMVARARWALDDTDGAQQAERRASELRE